MKNLIFTLILVLSNFVADSQVISVHVTGFQLYTRPKNETLSESQINNSLSYVSFNKLDSEYIFDLTNKTYSQKDNLGNTFWHGEITEIRYNDNMIDVSVGEVNFKLVPKNNLESDIFIIEYNNISEVTEGFFSMKNDFSYEFK